METEEQNIKLENLQYLCRACLDKCSSIRHNIDEMPTNLVNVFKKITGRRKKQKHFPDWICEQCYSKLQAIEDFQKVYEKSTQFLNNFVELYHLRPNKVTNERIFVETDVNKPMVDQPACSVDEILDPLNKNADAGFEEADIKLEKYDSVSTQVAKEQLSRKSTCHDIDLITEQGKNQEAIECKVETNENHNDHDSSETVTEDIVSKEDSPNKKRSKTKKGKSRKVNGKRNATENSSDEILCSKNTTCTVCHKNFNGRGGLNAHMRTHLVERPFQCEQCERGFNKRSLLNCHILEIHTDNPTAIVCKYGCGKIYYRQFSAMNHYRLKHIQPEKGIKKEYTCICEECGKVCKNKSILKQHRNIHLPMNQRPYHCEQCNKYFAMKKCYDLHLMRHAGIKRYQCTECDHKAVTRREIRLHMNYHTKEKKYYCPVCSKEFHSTGNMKRHIEVIHQGIKRYTCRFCEKSFGKPDTLKYHEMRHTGEKPNKCNICGKGFIQPIALKTHMKTHNKQSKFFNDSNFAVNQI